MADGLTLAESSKHLDKTLGSIDSCGSPLLWWRLIAHQLRVKPEWCHKLLLEIKGAVLVWSFTLSERMTHLTTELCTLCMMLSHIAFPSSWDLSWPEHSWQPTGCFHVAFWNCSEVKCTHCLLTGSVQTLKLCRVISSWPSSDNAEVYHVQGPWICVDTAEFPCRLNGYSCIRASKAVPLFCWAN